MKWLRRSGARPASTDIVRLLAGALAREQAAKTVSAEGDPAARVPTPGAEDEFRVQAQSMLYDFAMQHFSSQVEVLRREAVIEHLARQAQDRLSAWRLTAIGAAATLIALGLVRAGSDLAAHLGVDVSLLAEFARPLAASIRASAGV